MMGCVAVARSSRRYAALFLWKRMAVHNPPEPLKRFKGEEKEAKSFGGLKINATFAAHLRNRC